MSTTHSSFDQYRPAALVTKLLVIKQLLHSALKSGMWSRSRRLGLETVSRRTNVSSRSRLEKNCQRLGLGHLYVSCPRQFPDRHADGAVRSVNGL